MTQMKFIGLDVHKDTIAVAITDESRTGEVRFYGTICSFSAGINPLCNFTLIQRLAQKRSEQDGEDGNHPILFRPLSSGID